MHQPWDYLFEGQKIKSKGWDGMYILVDKETNYRVEVGSQRMFRGKPVTLTGGRAPKHESSLGKVWVAEKVGMGGIIHTPSVGLKWLKIKS